MSNIIPNETQKDKYRLDAFRIECQKAVESAKLTYLTTLGNSEWS